MRHYKDFLLEYSPMIPIDNHSSQQLLVAGLVWPGSPFLFIPPPRLHLITSSPGRDLLITRLPPQLIRRRWLSVVVDGQMTVHFMVNIFQKNEEQNTNLPHCLDKIQEKGRF